MISSPVATEVAGVEPRYRQTDSEAGELRCPGPFPLPRRGVQIRPHVGPHLERDAARPVACTNRHVVFVRTDNDVDGSVFQLTLVGARLHRGTAAIFQQLAHDVPQRTGDVGEARNTLVFPQGRMRLHFDDGPVGGVLLADVLHVARGLAADLGGVASRVDDASRAVRLVREGEVLAHQHVAPEAIQQEAVQELVDECRAELRAALAELVHGLSHEADDLVLVVDRPLDHRREGVERRAAVHRAKGPEGSQVDVVDDHQLRNLLPLRDTLDPPDALGESDGHLRRQELRSTPRLQARHDVSQCARVRLHQRKL
eukprot:CAMPEP_0115506868 /NCGR_PEP_ID=MMETSP0271-20121206/71412_1 /TAXON_ID=71861 /ORGANISM="Scrippsiella trochoidea, Strain CCMP3099" /LENGTH=312 /DNA_ID=CAMNT_0002936401 /DNA_START=87 /DNA_END=1022 /DNA_ORIENTATION=+